MKRALFAAVAFLFALSASAADDAKVREALLQLDYDRVIREVETMPEPSLQSRAFYVLALNRSGASGRATKIAEEMQAKHAGDPWAAYAMLAVTRSGDDQGRVEALLKAAGDQLDEEMARLAATMMAMGGKRDEALALIDKQPRTTRMILARANVLRMRVNVAPDEMGALASEVLAKEPDHLEALMLRADFDLEQGRIAESIALYERAVQLSPAINVHRAYWTALGKDKTLTPQARRERVEADMQQLMKQRGETPAVLYAIVEYYQQQVGDRDKELAYGDRILREAPASIQAQRVLSSRLFEDDDTPEAKERMRKAAEALIAWQHDPDPMLQAQAHQQMFLLLHDDEKAPVADLLRHAAGMKPLAPRAPSMVYALPALALAERGAHLDEAERLAREGIAAADPYFAGARKRMFGRAEDIERTFRMQRAAFHDALGWVLFQRGRFDEAEKELRIAHEYNPNSPDIAHRLGRYYESQRLFDKAEELYRKGMLLEAPGTNPNPDALKALYEKRRGSLDGWDAYYATMRDAGAAKRRQKVLAERVRGRATPAFALRTLDGRNVSLADLEGKIAVINFWGIWCGWCVKEMPEFQQLVSKYAKDQDVVILTINNDDNVDRVKKWMAEKKYSFGVLIDEAFAAKHVRVYPTTWFIDQRGELAFEKKGWTKELIEEFSWRIEALR